MQNVSVQKADGTVEPFDRSKLERSLRKAGASNKSIYSIVSHVEKELTDGMKTATIYHHAFELLKKEGKPLAARYSLRRALMDLGPSGFPFEQFVAAILREKGYEAQTNLMLRGGCTSHEIDVLAISEKELLLIEAKFHNKYGFKTDTKVALYVEARYRDLKKTQFDGKGKEGVVPQGWLITNTKFTRNAIEYGKCAGLTMVGWNYPHDKNLQDFIEETGLHPVSSLTTLSKKEKQKLYEKGVVLCRAIGKEDSHLKGIGLSNPQINEVLEEIEALCSR